MGNILLTNYCNRRCIYCFALDKVSAGAEDDGERRQSLKVEDFHHYLDFMRRSRLRVLSLLGGEPTLHPHFREIMDLCKTAPYVDHIKLFTNGLLPEPLLAYLIDYEGPALNIILNIHHPSEYPSGQWDKLTKFMMGLGDKIALGYNIYQTGNDFGFLLELFRQYKISHHVRLGLTQPILGANNIHLPLESLPDVAQEIVAAAHLFTREGLFFSFDCGFPFCMFSLDQHKELLSCAIKFRSSCNPVVDIGPDLSVWCCFPLSSIHNRHLQQFETRMDIEYYYSELFRPYRQFGIYPRCTECDYKIQGLCSGGCLSRVLREFQGGVVEEALVQQLAQGSP